MTETKTTCQKCGTELVPSKDNTTSLDGSLSLDGSWSMNELICPQCHPELVENQTQN